MLIEGVDDSVLSLVSVVIFISVLLMFNFIKNWFFSVRQENPTLHRDSVADINQVRNQTDLNANANANTTSDTPSSSAPTPNNQGRYTGPLNCPICIAETVLPYETNCGHIFCGNCIVQYWRHATASIFHSKIKCPMCRQFVTCFLPLYSRHDELRYNLANTDEIKTSIGNYNRRFSGAPRPWLDYITDIPVLLRHIFNEMFSLHGLELWHRIRWTFLMIMGLLYFISPFDILPEFIFGIFGLLDDLFVLGILIVYITILYRQVVANRQ